MKTGQELMHSRTQKAIENLSQIQWFSRVGCLETEQVVTVSGWKEAIRYCSQRKWEKIQLEAANLIRDNIIRNGSLQRYGLWNEVVNETKPLLMDILDQNLSPLIEKERLPPVIRQCVQWDMIHFLVECEFQDVYPHGFFHQLAVWYGKGHFPCGWNGNYSAWKRNPVTNGLIIF